MSEMVSKLFNDFDRGLISRRHLLQVLGVAAVTRPAMAFAQGSCGGANAGTPRCNTTPGKAPFAPTGIKRPGLISRPGLQMRETRRNYDCAFLIWNDMMIAPIPKAAANSPHTQGSMSMNVETLNAM